MESEDNPFVLRLKGRIRCCVAAAVSQARARMSALGVRNELAGCCRKQLSVNAKRFWESIQIRRFDVFP